MGRHVNQITMYKLDIGGGGGGGEDDSKPEGPLEKKMKPTT